MATSASGEQDKVFIQPSMALAPLVKEVDVKKLLDWKPKRMLNIFTYYTSKASNGIMCGFDRREHIRD